jgi:diguanylate cyclase (GGDEF)-like protein/PAS domain S-box-containing protein
MMSSIEPHPKPLKTFEMIDRMFELQHFALEHIHESVFFVDVDACITYVNRAAYSYLGYTKERLLEMSVLDIDPTFTLEMWRSHWEELKKSKNLLITTTHRKNDGTLTPVEISAHYFEYNGIGYNMAFSRDISEQKRIEFELNKQKNFQETLLFSIAKAGLGVHVIEDGRYIYTNDIDKAKQYGYDETFFEEKPHFIDTIHPDDQARVLEMYQRRLRGEEVPTTYELGVIQTDGVRKEHEVSIVPIPGTDPLQTIVVAKDITDRKMIEQKIEYMAHHDALTGLPNRVLAHDRMERAIAYAREHNTMSALLFIDLDGFKAINDTLGHSIGDRVLQSVSQRLRECLRERDTLSRQGGDEFLLILSALTTLIDIKIIAEKLIEAFDQPFYVQNHPLSLSASIGISRYPDDGADFETLLQSADMAMYKAKESGKNTYRFYTKEMIHHQLDYFTLQNDLKTAVIEKQFVLHYQPQIDLGQNRIVGVEALIRWRHPQRGMIPPMEFIPLAESSGLIVQIGEWVIREASAQAARWQSMGIEIGVAVNISGVQFKRGNLAEVVSDALKDSKLPPSYLELELTESIMMQDVESTLQMVHRLKAHGVQLSIDDFGTGYSSLAYLKRFALDKLKIDQSFVRDILSDQEDAIIVSTIVQMAKSLNLKTIAEGVENQAVLDVIESYGCDEVQGYHFAKPLEAAAFEAYHQKFYYGEEQ